MKVLKKVIAPVLAAVMVTGLFSGCKQNQKSSSVNSDKKVTVTFMDWESTDMDNALNDSMKKFMEKNPNIEVKMVPTPLSNYQTKLEEMIQAGSAPDIFRVGNNWCLQYGAKGILLDLSAYTKSDADFVNGFYPGYMDHFKVDSKLYGLPGLINTYGVFYNKDLFKKAGLSEPTGDWTYKDLLNDADKLKDTSKKVYGLYGDNFFDPFYMGLYSIQNGGSGLTDSIFPITKVTADSAFKDGVSTYAKYMANGAIAPTSYDITNLVSQFESGAVPMMWYGQWAASDIIQNAPSLNWGYVANPKGSANKSATLYDCTGFSILGKTKNPEAAYKVCKYIVSDAYEQILPSFPVAPSAYKKASSAYYDALKGKGHEDVGTAVDTMCNAKTKVASKFLDTYASKATAYFTKWTNVYTSKTQSNDIDNIMENVNKVISSSK